MDILQTLKSFDRPTTTNYIFGLDDTFFADNYAEIREQMVRLTNISLPLFYISGSAATFLSSALEKLKTAARNVGQTRLNLMLDWSPYHTYAANIQPLASGSGLAIEQATWDTWLGWWKNKVDTSDFPINVSFSNDTECYHVASYSIPTSGAAIQAAWDADLKYRFQLVDTMISGYFPNSKIHWYALGQVANGSVSPYFPTTYLGKNNGGPFNAPVYYSANLDRMQTILTDTATYATSKSINQVVPILAFNHAWKSGVGVTSDISWPTTNDTRMATMMRSYSEVLHWFGTTVLFDTTGRTSADLYIANNNTFWTHFLAYMAGLQDDRVIHKATLNAIKNNGATILGVTSNRVYINSNTLITFNADRSDLLNHNSGIWTERYSHPVSGNGGWNDKGQLLQGRPAMVRDTFTTSKPNNRMVISRPSGPEYH